MTSDRNRWIIHYLLILGFVLALAGFQTAAWPELFGFLPPPMLWLLVIVYLALYREIKEVFFLVYLLGIVVASFSAMLAGITMLVTVAIYFSGRFLRSRIFWSGTSYFVMVAALAAPAFHLYHFVLSWLFEANPLTSPRVGRWAGEFLLTPLFAYLLFPIFEWVDQLPEGEGKRRIEL